MSREEIYRKHIGSNMELEYKPTPRESVWAAMDEFSKNQAIAFGEYLRENGYEPRDKTGQEAWKQMGTKIGWLQPGMSIIVPTENVFDDFLEHQKQQTQCPK